MAGVMIQMKLAMLRNTPGGIWNWKTFIGFGLALGTVLVALSSRDDPAAATDLLAFVFATWLLGWMVRSVQTGGGEESLLPEQFSLLPVTVSKLSLGLLAAAFVGPGPLVTLIAFAGLGVLAVSLGVGPGLIAIPAILLQLVFVILLSRVAVGAVSSAMKSRLGLEFAAVQWALLISILSVGWFLLSAFGENGQLELPGDRLAEGTLPATLATVVRALPSGWGPVAVEAAGDADWLLAIGALVSLMAITGILLLVWIRILSRRLTMREAGSSAHVAVASGGGRSQLLPDTPIGGVVRRELRTWIREPRSALELRVVILSGLFIAVFPLIVGWSELLPWAGAIIAVIAGMGACNAYGLEGSALWLTLMTPNAERADVRGKQWAFLLIFAPVCLAVTVIFVALSGQNWAWPWVLAAVPALLGGAAGLMILMSVLGAAPVPEAARRSGNLMASADNTGPVFVMMFLAPLSALPAVGVVLAGAQRDSVALQWVGVPVGVGTGILLAWWFGRIAVQKLETGGPELLMLLRFGKQNQGSGET